VSNLTEKFVILAGVLIAFATSGSLGAISLGYLIGGVVRLAIPLVLVSRRLKLSRPRVARMTDSIKRSIPIGFSAASMSLIARFDVAAVGVISTIAAASFAIGDRVVSALLVIPLARPESRNARTFLTMSGLFFVAGSAIAAVAIALAPTLVPLIFGDKYEDSVTTVQIMLGVLPFVFAGGALVATLYSLRRELRVAVTAGPAVVVGLIAVIAGQLAFGPEGAAAGYLARQILIVVGLTIQLLWVLRIPGALDLEPDVDTEQLIVEEEIASGI
jgi:O-antigen/teichoic acid export membrane protein